MSKEIMLKNDDKSIFVQKIRRLVKILKKSIFGKKKCQKSRFLFSSTALEVYDGVKSP